MKHLFCLDVTVELFGSSLSGFALKESDMNINLNYPVQEDEKYNVSGVYYARVEHASQ